MNKNKKYVFVAHYVEPWNWLLKFKFFDDLHKHPEHARRWFFLAPIYLAASVFYLFSRKDYDIVDRFTFAGIPAETWLIRNFSWHFLWKGYWKVIRERISRTVLEAQGKKFTHACFGALLKDAQVNDGGELTVKKLGDKLKIPILHGDTLTAAVVARQVFMLIDRFYLRDTPVFLIGATSKIGRAVALKLAERKICVYMHTGSASRFAKIKEEAGIYGEYLTHAPQLSRGKECLLWITGKAKPKGRILKDCLPVGAVVLNFSVPDPLKPHNLRKRQDVHHFDGGLVGYDPAVTDLHFSMRLRRNESTYACHGGGFVQTGIGVTNHEVGQVVMSQMDPMWDTAVMMGFTLPRPTSFLQPVELPPKHKSSAVIHA